MASVRPALRAKRVPILTYHAVGEPPQAGPLSVTRAQFAAQMRALAEAGYCSVPLLRLVEGLRDGGASLPERPVAITFDDGYRSVLEIAAPILRDHGFTATVFLVTGAWPAARWPRLTWPEVETLAANGFELGTHTVTHPVLSKLMPVEAEREMAESQQAILQHTGQAARLLGYPYGARSRAVEGLARRYFDGACGTMLGLSGTASNLFNLERVDAYYLNPPSLAARLETAPVAGYLTARRALRWARRLVRPDWAGRL